MKEDLCKRCGNCCRNIPIDIANRVMFRDGIQPLNSSFENMLEIVEIKEHTAICRCKFLKDNICKNPNKPEECKNFPSFPFAFLPDNCGYEGEIFLINEKIKHKIRKLKEEILDYEILVKTSKYKSDREQYQKLINSHKSFINKYSAYGSNDW